MNHNRKYKPDTYKHVAIDFDNTITEGDSFPELGTLKYFAIETMNAMLKAGYNIHIWSSRPESQQESILEFLTEEGLDTTNVKINEHFPHYLGKYSERSSKIYADVYIEDRAYGAPEIYWPDVYRAFIN